MKVLRLKDTIWSQNFIFKGKKTANIYCTLKKKKKRPKTSQRPKDIYFTH